MNDTHKWLKQLAKQIQDEKNKGAAPKGESLTVKELLSRFGYSRRGHSIVAQIRNEMDRVGLRTVPDFEYAFIDSEITIQSDSEAEFSDAGREPDDSTHRIGTLEAANRKPVRVNPEQSINVATTLMHLNGFSQLPVMKTDHKVDGIISWKSIGIQASLGKDCKKVSHCMEPAQETSINTPLLDVIGTITEHGYVLVRGASNEISGIVTESDLSRQFMTLAGPFLLIGEIEGHLRQLIHNKFTVDELQEANNELKDRRAIVGSADLTLGGYCRLLENKGNWEKLNVEVDRHEFVSQIDEVRKLRNDVMHFDPEGLSEDDTRMLRNVARFLEQLVRTSLPGGRNPE